MQETDTHICPEEGTDSAREFLRRALSAQTTNIAAHEYAGERVWIKKAGPRNSAWRYAVMGGLARGFGLGVLRPVPNLGGERAIAIERARLRELSGLGLPVPVVLAASAGGLMLRDLAWPTTVHRSLAREIRRAPDSGRSLVLFEEGLRAVARVHDAGSCLSQAFARNLVRTSEGTLGYIDFEDDPAQVLSQAECEARDWLCYLHSTAQGVQRLGGPDAGVGPASDFLAERPVEVRRILAATISRLRWLRRLPGDRRFGTDIRSLHGAAQLMVRLDLGV